MEENGEIKKGKDPPGNSAKSLRHDYVRIPGYRTISQKPKIQLGAGHEKMS